MVDEAEFKENLIRKQERFIDLICELNKRVYSFKCMPSCKGLGSDILGYMDDYFNEALPLIEEAARKHPYSSLGLQQILLSGQPMPYTIKEKGDDSDGWINSGLFPKP